MAQQTYLGAGSGIQAVADLPIGVAPVTLHQGVIAATGTSAVVWTPSASTLRFRLLGWEIVYTDNATLATAAIITVSLLDGATVICSWPVFIPATAISAAGTLLVSRIEKLPAGGYNSLALNNNLSLSLSSAVVGGSFQAMTWGLENP